MKRKLKIFFLVPYPLNEAPSQRFRFEQYFRVLDESGFGFAVQSFLTADNWRTFYDSSKSIQKMNALIIGFIKRILILPRLISYDFIFVHREITPIGPPVFEWIIACLFRKRIIYDFDDAIWMTDKTNESWIERSIRCRGKVKWICKWSNKISCGSDFLCDYAKKFNKTVVCNPTTIDTDHTHNNSFHSKISSEKIIIGWTGSHSTLKYLKELEPTLQRLEKKFQHVEFWVIADRAPDLNLLRLNFKRWSLKTEVSDLAQFDIGIMPLPDDEWTKGKCGFKALQYMSMEIPTIASTVGVNATIIEHEVNGLLAGNVGDWEGLLSRLVEDKSLRIQLGKEGRKSIEKEYSIFSNRATFLSLFS